MRIPVTLPVATSLESAATAISPNTAGASTSAVAVVHNVSPDTQSESEYTRELRTIRRLSASLASLSA